MLMLWQQSRKKWSVKTDKNLYTEIKDNNGNLKGWVDKRYLKSPRKNHFYSWITKKTVKNKRKSLTIYLRKYII